MELLRLCLLYTSLLNELCVILNLVFQAPLLFHLLRRNTGVEGDPERQVKDRFSLPHLLTQPSNCQHPYLSLIHILTDLKADSFKAVRPMVRALKDLDKETREALLKFMSILFMSNLRMTLEGIQEETEKSLLRNGKKTERPAGKKG